MLVCHPYLKTPQVHHKSIVSNHSMVSLLQQLDRAVRGRIERERSTVGYNLAALRFIQRSLEQTTSSSFFENALSTKQATAAASTAELRRQTIARKQLRKK